MSVVYIRRYEDLQSYDTEFISKIEEFGYSVTCIDNDTIPTYDFSSIKLVIVGPPGSAYVSLGNISYIVDLEISAIAICRHTARVAFGMAGGSGSSTYDSITIEDEDHEIVQGFTGTVTISDEAVTSHRIGVLDEATDLIAFVGGSETLVALADMVIESESNTYSRIFWGFHDAENINSDGWTMFSNMIKYGIGDLIVPMGEVLFQSKQPNIDTNCPVIRPPSATIDFSAPIVNVEHTFQYNIVYSYRRGEIYNFDQAYIDYLENMGCQVTTVTEEEMLWYDFSDTEIIIIGSTEWNVEDHPAYLTLSKQTIPVINMCRRLSTQEHPNGFRIATSSASNVTNSHVEIIDENHLIIKFANPENTIISIDDTESMWPITTVAENVDRIAQFNVTGRTAIAEKMFEINGHLKPVVHWSLHRADLFSSEEWNLFNGIIRYLRHISITNKQIGFTAYNGLLPNKIQRKYPNILDVSDFCPFVNPLIDYSDNTRFEQIYIEDQRNKIILDVGPYADYAPWGHKDDTANVIKCRPFDTLTISVRIANERQWNQRMYLSFGHSIDIGQLLKIADLSNDNVIEHTPWVYTYSWQVPNEPGIYLFSWWAHSNSYREGCSPEANMTWYSVRYSCTLWILPSVVGINDFSAYAPEQITTNSFILWNYDNDTSDTNFEALVPTISSEITIWEGKKVVYSYGGHYLHEDETLLIETLEEEYGMFVYSVHDEDIGTYDFSDIDLLIVGLFASTSTQTVGLPRIHRYPRTLRYLKVPILSMRSNESCNVLGMVDGAATRSVASMEIHDETHPITKGLSGVYTVSSTGSYTFQTAMAANRFPRTVFLARASTASSRMAMFSQRRYIDGDLYDRVHFGAWRTRSHNRNTWQLLERIFKFLLQPKYTAITKVEGIAPRIITANATVKVPYRKTKVVYLTRVENDYTDVTNYLASLGYDATHVAFGHHSALAAEDSDIIIAGGISTLSTLSSINAWCWLFDVPRPVFTRDINLAIGDYNGISSRGFMIGSSSSSTTWNYLRPLDLTHPINKGFVEDQSIYVTDSGSIAHISSGNLHSNARGILSTTNASQVVIAEKDVQVPNDANVYPRIFLGLRETDAWLDGAWDILGRTAQYCAPVHLYTDISMEGLSPIIVTSDHIDLNTEEATSSVEGIAPTDIGTNSAIIRPNSSNIPFSNPIPQIFADVFIRPSPAVINFNGLSKEIKIEKYKSLYLPLNIEDYCSFSGGTSSYGQAFILNIHVENQDNVVLLDSGPYDTFHPDRWRVNIDQVIVCNPGDILTISVEMDQWSSATFDVYLYWGNAIYTPDLALTELLTTQSISTDPYTYVYTWEVPERYGLFLISWAVRRGGTMDSLCGYHLRAERHDHGIQIGTPDAIVPYYVFIGNIDSPLVQKTMLPMLGGFLTIEDLKIEDTERLIGGSLTTNVKTTKKRFTFTFQNMLVSDFNKWDSEQRLNKFREIDYLDRSGNLHRAIVKFVTNYSHLKLRTKDKWVYGQISFILEEV